MAGSIFGTLFRVSTFGESHGTALGAVIDGCPAGLPLSAEEIQAYLNRRKPGQSAFTTPRKEADACEILSGVFEGKTLGTPIAVLVRNKDQHSADYQAIWDCYRPGHADFGFDRKFGFRDPRGGGRSSGRETTGRGSGGAPWRAPRDTTCSRRPPNGPNGSSVSSSCPYGGVPRRSHCIFGVWVFDQCRPLGLQSSKS